MATELVITATGSKLREMDWMKNIEICEIVARDQRQAKDVIKAIKKRLKNGNANNQLFAVLLLEMLMNNCGEHIHRQVIEMGLLPILVKIVKKQSDVPVREKIFLLLDATQTSLGGASGKFPQYYAAYYDLVSARVKFPQCPYVPPSAVQAAEASANTFNVKESSHVVNGHSPKQLQLPDSSIIHKATNVLEVLREVLDGMDPQHPEGATEEFTLDLVEQCSFQKERVMHLVMVSRDEKVVSQAIELNEQLEKVIIKHDVLLSVQNASTSDSFNHRTEEEDADRLFRRKGKACVEAEPERLHPALPSSGDQVHRPLIRPLILEPQQAKILPAAVSIPPPPAKHVEREKFFKETRPDGMTLASHIRGLSINSHSGSSSSLSTSTDSSE